MIDLAHCDDIFSPLVTLTLKLRTLGHANPIRAGAASRNRRRICWDVSIERLTLLSGSGIRWHASITLALHSPHAAPPSRDWLSIDPAELACMRFAAAVRRATAVERLMSERREPSWKSIHGFRTRCFPFKFQRWQPCRADHRDFLLLLEGLTTAAGLYGSRGTVTVQTLTRNEASAQTTQIH